MTEEQIKEAVEELYLFLQETLKPGLEELIELEQGLEFETTNGVFTIVNHNSHNGYYGGFWVEFETTKELVEYAETSEDYKDSVFVHIFNLNQHFNND